jgi:release factor glutamine methyltransferase
MALDVASVSRTHWSSEVYEPSDDSFALVDALQQGAAGWKAPRPRTCAEIGCGSGYVICSLALLLRQLGVGSSLYATDVSQHALDATRRTLASHGVPSVELLRTNLLDGLLGRLQRQVDILVRGQRAEGQAAGAPGPDQPPPHPAHPPARRRACAQVFNPPYVPTPDEEVQRGGIAAAWAGGYKGRVVIDRVLEQVGEGPAPQVAAAAALAARATAATALPAPRQARRRVVRRREAPRRAAGAPALLQLDRILAPGGQLYMVTVLENEPEAIIADMAARGYTGGRRCCAGRACGRSRACRAPLLPRSAGAAGPGLSSAHHSPDRRRRRRRRRRCYCRRRGGCAEARR